MIMHGIRTRASFTSDTETGYGYGLLKISEEFTMANSNKDCTDNFKNFKEMCGGMEIYKIEKKKYEITTVCEKLEVAPVRREKKTVSEDELTSVPRTSDQKQTQYSSSISSETVQNGKRPNLCDDALQYSDDCSQPINNTSCSLLNNTESPEKNFQSDCSHNSQNTCMFQDGSSTCSSLEESLKSDNQNDSDSNNINQYEFSTDSLDSIDKESFNSSFHSEETIYFSFHSDESTNSSFHSDNETETDREENLTEKESNDFGIPEKEFQTLSLVSCFLRNKFSASTTRDVINTFKCTFPSCEELSDMDFGKIMSNIEDVSLKEFHYCIICKQVFPSNVDMFCCGTTNCEGLRYKGPLSSQQKKRTPTFAEQLTDLLQTPGIWDDIQFNREASFERKNNGSKELTDITDGASYRAMMGDGLFLDRTKNNLTAIFNTDGVSLYSSSKIELWPIFLAINELSPMFTLRTRKYSFDGALARKG
ncbi:hypothetical protein KUTeg_002805 [Tegillarca granosa]|uniref:Uncharacterized protein n=1 Tax=Tegillarca granosa TaxID=220873 RepID=A0ABQ9FQS0_TEGGR|nr:hypothetical protein KUTeg_002805 [Tegillarca granosa]